jgi:hypothetical protein
MKMHITAAAVAVGVMLASVPAFAQYRIGRAPNDGGDASVMTPPPSKPIYNMVPAPVRYGRNYNDGATVEVSPAQSAAARKVTWTKYPPHVGRALNDGGF